MPRPCANWSCNPGFSLHRRRYRIKKTRSIVGLLDFFALLSHCRQSAEEKAHVSAITLSNLHPQGRCTRTMSVPILWHNSVNHVICLALREGKVLLYEQT